jgi:hypothetical protein
MFNDIYCGSSDRMAISKPIVAMQQLDLHRTDARIAMSVKRHSLFAGRCQRDADHSGRSGGWPPDGFSYQLAPEQS